jgi:TetR/AcrR family transcriptional regulator, transcriptional repressor for nem operon
MHAVATRERILDSATTLLLDRGYGATSIDEVCSVAEVTKGGLFYHFDSKQELASAAIERFFAGLVAAGESERSGDDLGATEALHAYIASLPVLIEGPLLTKGCLLGAMAIQTTESHPEVHASAQAALGEWRAGLVGLFEAAAKERQIEIDAGELADGLLSAVEGGLLLNRAGVSSNAAVAAVNHFRNYLSIVFGDAGGKRGAGDEGKASADPAH